MNSSLASNIIRFIVLLLVQVTICNNINLLGYINPYIYVIFILLFPVKNNRLLFLVLAFNLGLLVDMFLDSGGVHAGASVFLAFARPVFLKYAFGTLYDHQTLKFGNSEIGALIMYVSGCVILHHLILFYLEIFNISQIILLLKKALFSSIFTVSLSLLLILLFKPRK
ncbi:rod shape-determining protein MreD [uncultured Winogradskyella sp.]|uniref:rod shape-determining protein MreD n=1 Tax=uncultured Winogradskyella sp. TaxID=395353 RepID=UPI00260AC500|nr:rod shape-determining protein MreD [uncultured Winogradskyella sp.]